MTDLRRILILEDVPTDAEIARREIVRAGVDATFETREDEPGFLAALENFRPDLVVSDYKLPTFDGMTALRLTLEHAPGVPFIIVTGSMNEETAVDCMKAGAADYVLKEHIGRLGPAVVSALERRRLLEEKTRTEQQLRQLVRAVEQSPVSVLVTDVEGTIEYVNPTLCRVTGYSREELLGSNPRILKSGQTPPETYTELWRAIAAGGIWRGELLNRRKDGSTFWESVSISALRSPAGTITHYVGVKEDVNARKEAERELRETQAQLLQSQKMEAIGRLAGGVAHDFNNLLNVIYGYGEMLHESLRGDDAGLQKLEQILRAAERAAGLTRQLLAFGRKQVMEPRVLDLGALVAETEKMLRRLVSEDIEISYVRPSSEARVSADPGQIEQVLLNLVVNARDAMPDGGRLTVEVASAVLDEAYCRQHPPARPGPYVLLAVTDTGHGMDAATQARIFEPFYTTKELGKGTGLGLATVYGIVKQHGGVIWVYSEVGTGTVFKIYLPTADAALDEATESEPAPALSGEGTVLLVEDDDDVRVLAHSILASGGYDVLAARSGDEALLAAERHAGAVDVLLTDVVMPGMNGRELSERLHMLRPGVSVVFMSGYTHDAIARRGMLEPGPRYLQKPFTSEALLRIVRDATGRGTGRA